MPLVRWRDRSRRAERLIDLDKPPEHRLRLNQGGSDFLAHGLSGPD